jgi:hypothetical protein
MKTELDLIAEDYRKAAEHHASECRFAQALGYLELYFATAADEEEEEE